MMAMNFNFKVPTFMKSVRHSLFAVNSIFLLTGFLLLLVGIIIQVKFSVYEELITERFLANTRFVIAISILIFLISGLGFYAALSQNFLLIVAYVGLLFIILVFDIIMLTLGYSLSNDAPSDIQSSMVQSLILYGSRLDITILWDDLQMDFECCGVAGRFDYISNSIPVSCCHIDYGTISPFECNTANANSVGCASVLGEYLSHQALIIGITGIVVTVIMVILTAAAAGLAWRSKFEVVELES